MSLGVAASRWQLIPRTRFASLWHEPAPLTVLAGLPGWGRTELMRQARAACDARGTVTHGFTARSSLEAALAQGTDAAAVVFVDDVPLTVDDPLWQQLAATGAAVVIAADDPPASLHDGTVVLDERELGFDEDEIAALIAANAVIVATDSRDDLHVRLHGWPALVRAQLERLQQRHRQQVWASLAPRVEGPRLAALLNASDDERGLTGLLRRGAAFRSFSARLVAQDRSAGDAAGDAAAFGRLAALPFGHIDLNDETGEHDFVWTPGAWQTIDDTIDADRRRAQLEATLPRLRRDGRITSLLLPLLILNRLDEADALVFDQHRRFLIFTDADAQRELLSRTDVSAHPSLLLLTAELRLRTAGANVQTIRDAEHCLAAFAPASDDDELRRFRLACRRAIAATYTGRRRESVRLLASIVDMLDTVAGSSVRNAAGRRRDVAVRVSADLFLPFWAAAQTDQHDIALELMTVALQYADEDDVVTYFDHLTAMTEQDFAGLRSLDRHAARPEPLQFSHAAALVLLEEGEDAEALERTHPLAARVRPAPTRSPADATLILTRALVAPDRLAPDTIELLLELSATFWDDGRPSSFIAFAAVVAHLASGRTAHARAVAATVATDDWFGRTAHALIAIAAGDPETAMSLLTAARETTALPRLQILTEVLLASTFATRNMPDAAAARLRTAWDASPAPRLFRFALRFLHTDDFAALRACAARTDVDDVFTASAADHRPSVRRVEAITEAERDILALLTDGRTNAEIAAIRGVSHNTVRTQLRLLYRKIGVTDRAGAVAFAERQRLTRRATPAPSRRDRRP